MKLFIEVEKKKANFLLKMTNFFNDPVKTYPPNPLNVKGLWEINNNSLCMIDKRKELNKKQKKNGVTEVKVLSIKNKIIKANLYISMKNIRKNQSRELYGEGGTVCTKSHEDAINTKNMTTTKATVEDVCRK